MPPQLLEITATFLREAFRFDETIIGEGQLCEPANGASKKSAVAAPLSTAPGPATTAVLSSLGFRSSRRSAFVGVGSDSDSAREAWNEPSDPFASLSSAPATPFIKLKGPAEPDELEPHLSYRFYGRWVEHPRHGRQFHFQTFVRCQPHSRAGVVKYLAAAPNIGQVVAQTLWEKFGSDAVRVVRESPEVAAAAVRSSGVNSFTEERAHEAATHLADDTRLEGCTLDLMDLLSGHGFHKTLPKALITKYGNRAPEIVRANPYVLLRFRGHGCGFSKVDRLYLTLGLPAHKLKRQALCARHAIVECSDGHTWLPIQVAIQGITAKIGGVHPDPPRALRLAKRAGLIASRRDEMNRIWVALDSSAVDEETIARRVFDSFRETPSWPKLEAAAPGESGLSLHQADQFSRASGGTIAMFGGGPGTGKTYTVAWLVRAIQSQCPGTIAVAAPTGKASVRVTESMAAHGLPIRATTIHSLLGVETSDKTDGFGFRHGPENPLPFGWIIVDEASMIDAPLFASLLSARAAGTHLLLVGDINQLPPVGHGAPLRDLIAVGLPYGELTEIRRNSGTIVRTCKDIREGRRFALDASLDLPPWPMAAHADDTEDDSHPARNLKLLEAATPDAQITVMLRALVAARAEGQNPIWDCQVLGAVNAKGDLSRKKLNEILQRELNKTGERVGSNPFLVGDKIVNTKNGSLPLTKSYKRWLEENCTFEPGPFDGRVYLLSDGSYVSVDAKGRVYCANGELAEVMSVEDKFTVARLSAPRREIVIPRGGAAGGSGGGANGQEGGGKAKSSDDDEDGNGGSSSEESTTSTSTGCKWDLGYCLSVHKSQGSEWPTVIVMLDDSSYARRVACREWFYTAISRPKRVGLLVGVRATADEMCRRVSLTRRKTFLVERIKELVAAQALVEQFPNSEVELSGNESC